ncbi:uncharacterized protein ALTATR162_LOCUS6957 [Alternaria atra]|uniref:RING-type domain-containing protein n=1 Tax=Alternaria atra TaxID=119953 RepID=A0A8J2N770_9PLEO|nr:uncharacterized protein ALTATR162_LOCUS6957 [Alternaria atra]CAG5166642.1 unnamed protein product [Alternaria atra]
MSANYSQLDDDDHDITHPHHDHDHDHDSPLDPYSRFDFGHLFGDYSAPVQEEGEQFDDAYRAPPAPYSTGFFDHILNPAGLDHGRYSPFAWRPYSPLTSDMAPTTRARPDRLANGYVDLTSAPDSPPPRRKRESPTPGPSAKRQKKDDGSAAEVEEKKEDDEKVQELDLTEQKTPLQEALQKQQEDAVKVQAKPEETVTTFNSFNCVICMDNPTDLTATACGHLFCHTCLMEALIAGENRTGPHETKRSQCPVCRKTISRNKATDVIPLLLKKGLATQPRKKAVASAAVTASKVA